MGEHTEALRRLSEETIASGALAQLEAILGKGRPHLGAVIALDRRIGGPSAATIDDGVRGRYAGADRDVFRPFQYCRAHFAGMLVSDDGDWLARDIVEMSSLHIEALVKRIGGVRGLPLGRALRTALARRRIEPMLWSQIDAFTGIYNSAKHHFAQPKDTHLFSVEDALLAYSICRALGAKLYPLARLATDLRVFG